MRNERVKNLIKYVVPATLSLVSVFFFSVIDGIFVGRGVGTDGLGAVNIAFPFIMIFTAVVMLVTVGGLTITAIRKGRKDEAGANQAFMHSMTATLVVGVVFTILGTVFVKQMATLVGSNETFFDYVCDYIFWYAVFMIPCGLHSAVNGFVRNDGNPVLVSIATVVSTMLNIFLDWLFVFPLQMGLKGAAIATGISQTVGLFISLIHFIFKKGNLKFSSFTVDLDMYKKILLRGLPECISQFSAPICMVVTNIVILKMLGDTAENAYSVIGYVAAFSVAAFVGVAEGLQPLFGNCYGAGLEEDLKWYRNRGLVIGFVGAFVIFIAVLFASKPICKLYGLDENTTLCTLDALPKYSIGFLIQSSNVIISSYLYSTTRTSEAIIINVLRSFTLNIIVIYFVPMLFGADTIWYTFAIFEGIVMIAAYIMMFKADSKQIINSSRE